MDESGKLIAVIGDEVRWGEYCVLGKSCFGWPTLPPFLPLSTQDTVTGFLLAGIGHRTVENSNFFVVKPGRFCPLLPPPNPFRFPHQTWVLTLLSLPKTRTTITHQIPTSRWSSKHFWIWCNERTLVSSSSTNMWPTKFEALCATTQNSFQPF